MSRAEWCRLWPSGSVTDQTRFAQQRQKQQQQQQENIATVIISVSSIIHYPESHAG